MARRTATLLLLALVVLAWPTASHARVTVDRTTLRYQPGGGGSGIASLTTLRLRGDRAGDAVGVRRRNGRLLVTARRGTLRARGRACRQHGPRTVTCPVLEALDAVLGAGDDTLVLHTRFVRRTVAGGSGDDVLEDRFTRCPDGCGPVPGVGGLAGGPGDDRLLGQDLLGGDGDDLLRGTGADDTLTPGPGRDRVLAGAGDDRLALDADGEIDLIDGGPGRDLAYHELLTAPLTVDLAAGTALPGDELTAVEDATGGRGRDVLRGDDGPNALHGDEGSDQQPDLLDGRGGDDRLGPGTGDTALGGDGDDVVDGYARGATVDAGPGDDLLRLKLAAPVDDARGNDLRCGPGTDTVDGPSVGDLVRADCERVRGAAILTARSLSADRTALTSTFVTAGPRACHLQVVAFADATRARTLGRAETDLPAGGGSVTIPLDGPLAAGELALQYRLSGCVRGADAATTGPFRLEVAASS